MAKSMTHSTRPFALSGILASAAALAFAELIAGLVESAPSLIRAIGDAAIDATPPFLKDFAVTTFGTADKPILLAGIVVVALLFGAALGIASRTRPWVGMAGIAVFGLLGGLAGAADPLSSALAAWLSAITATAVGVYVLRRLTTRADAWDTPSAPEAYRRDFLRAAGATGVLTVLGGVVGRALSAGSTVVEEQRQALVLPVARQTLPPKPSGLDVRGLTPLYVPNSRFYRIDTALRVPRVDIDAWTLELGGPLVADPITYSLDDLLNMDLVEQDITIACVSNEVGGDLVGNARWLGVPLATLLAPALEQAKSQSGAQVVGRSVDGFTAAFPVEALDDNRVALLAVGMNGDPLPARHGFPARLVVSGLYGYVSATKWLQSIELHGPDFQGYWIPRGWAKEAPVKTQSRIDVPRQGARVAAGSRPIAGVAWAPNRGVMSVEVRVDDGEWREARLSEPLGPNAWRQWMVDWDAEPGRHRISVRATDGLDRTQPERRLPPRPDGATGWHTISVDVATP